MPIVADGVTDDAPAINAALTDPTVDVLQLAGGVHALGSSVRIPRGKSLLGAGRERTTLKALPLFDRTISINGVVATEEEAHGVNVADLLIDGSLVGLGAGDSERICGLMMLQSRGFSVRRVDVKDVTGYAHFARGLPANSNAIPASGRYDECRTWNAQIHYEQMACDGILLTNVEATSYAPGENVVGCTNFFHCVSGSRDITYNHARGQGAASAGVELTADVGPQLDLINFFDTHVVVDQLLGTTYGQAFVSNGANGLNNLNIQSCRLSSLGGAGLNLNNTTGQIGGGTVIEGRNIGAILNNSVVNGDSSSVIGYGVGTNGVAYGITGSQIIHWNGGLIAARPTGTGNAHPHPSNVLVMPATAVEPRGGGYYLTRTMSGNHGNSSLSPVVIGTPQVEPWSFPVKAGRRYRVSIIATVQSSSMSGGVVIGIRASASASARGVMSLGSTIATITAAGAFMAPGSYVSQGAWPAANQDLALRGDFVVAAAADGTVTLEMASTVTGIQALITKDSSLQVLEV